MFFLKQIVPFPFLVQIAAAKRTIFLQESAAKHKYYTLIKGIPIKFKYFYSFSLSLCAMCLCDYVVIMSLHACIADRDLQANVVNIYQRHIEERKRVMKF